MDWINLVQNRDLWRALVNTAMNLRETLEQLLKKGSVPWS
jgi:hypothetical protein